MISPCAPLPARVPPSAVDVVDPAGLAAQAAEVASCQRSPQTRRTYASVYRSLIAFLGAPAAIEDLTSSWPSWKRCDYPQHASATEPETTIRAAPLRITRY